MFWAVVRYDLGFEFKRFTCDKNLFSTWRVTELSVYMVWNSEFGGLKLSPCIFEHYFTTKAYK